MKLIDIDEHWEIPFPSSEEFELNNGNLIYFLCGMEWVSQHLKSFPAIDLVRAAGVCFCEECVHFEPREEADGENWTGFCKYGDHHTDEMDFCSRGRRRGT